MKRQPITLSTGIVLIAAAVLTFGLAGCQTKTDEAEDTPPDTGSEFADAGATAEPEPEPVPVAAVVEFSADPVYFDFDKSDVRDDQVGTVRGAGQQLNDSGTKIVIEGHTDNRGSEEYNLALGERRAASVRRYLANLGVPMRQMTIVSYGEIRPAAQGNTEDSWSENRRAEFESAD
jgi:peptidoglycan-associated lipoprotein